MKPSTRTLLCLLLIPLIAQVPPGYAESQQEESPDQAVEEGGMDTRHAAPPEGQLRGLPPRGDFSGIQERPLFRADRRPGVEENNDQEMLSAADLREQWSLTGIIVVGEYTRAMLEKQDEELMLTLEAGMPLDDSWVLQSIESDYVIMDRGDQQVRLELRTPRDTTPVTPIENASAAGTDSERSDAQTRQEARPVRPRRLQQNTEARDE